MRQLEEQVEQFRAQLEEAEQQGDSLLEEINQLRRENGDRGRTLEEKREKLQQLRARHTSLEALQKAARGDDGAVSEWLERHDLDQAPRLADHLEVEPGWERAVEAVLGDALQGLQVKGLSQVSDWLADLSHGRICLLSDDASRATAKGARPLLSLVKGAAPDLLTGVQVAEDLSEALSLRDSLAAGESVVTREGIWLGRDWLRVAREQDNEAGILERRRELEQLDGEIATLEEQVASLREALEANRERVQQVEEEREDVQRQGSRINRELGEVNAQVSARQVRLEQITMRRERLGKELEESSQQRDSEQEQVKEARASLSEALDAMEQHSGERENLLSRRDSCRQKLDECRQQARQHRDSAHHLAMEVQGARTQLDSLRQGLSRLDAQSASLAQRRELLQRQLAEGDESGGQEVQHQLEEKLERRLETEQQLMAVRRELEEIEHTMRTLDGERQQFERESQEIKGNLDQKRMAWQEIKVRRTTVQEQLSEQDFDLDTVLANLPEQADESAWAAELD